MKKRTRSSTPIFAVATPRSFRMPRDQRAADLVFLPDADVVRELDHFARALLLEAGRHVRDVALRRNDQQERPLAQAPAHVDEVGHARAALEDDRADALFASSAAALSRCARAARRRQSAARDWAAASARGSTREPESLRRRRPALRQRRNCGRARPRPAAAEVWTNVRLVMRMMRDSLTDGARSCSEHDPQPHAWPCRSVLMQRRLGCRLNYGQMSPLRRRCGASPDTKMPARSTSAKSVSASGRRWSRRRRRARRAPVRVLVADDSDLLVGLIASWLEDEGLRRRRPRARGARRSTSPRVHHPDVVLLDLIMPQLDGFEVCGKLKRLPQPPEIILMTGVSDPAHLHRAMDLCAATLLRKPLDAETVVAAVRAPARAGARVRSRSAGEQSSLTSSASGASPGSGTRSSSAAAEETSRRRPAAPRRR